MLVKRKGYNNYLIFFLALCLSYIITIAGILILSLCLLIFQLSLEQAEFFLVWLHCLSSFVGGGLIGKRSRKYHFFKGMGAAGIYYSCILLLSYLQGKTIDLFFTRRLTVLILILFFGGIGSKIFSRYK